MWINTVLYIQNSLMLHHSKTGSPGFPPTELAGKPNLCCFARRHRFMEV